MRSTLLVIYMLTFSHWLMGQEGAVAGRITNQDEEALAGVNITIQGAGMGTTTNQAGEFQLVVSQFPVSIVFSHIGYEQQVVTVTSSRQSLFITMQASTEVLHTVEVKGEQQLRDEASVTKITPKSIEALPTPFRDFTKILAALPGVASNNELSSTYSVRGGSFDENLIYVNDMPVYRPFLISNGQQEGLSFVNSALVSAVTFSAGGWQPRYGDKLSSVLNVQYKRPKTFGASASISLLGGSAHSEGTFAEQRGTYVVGVRHKSSRYLLNTLETSGQYLPRFTDVQSYVSYRLGDKTSLGLLASYARNRYQVTPANRETEFGTFNRSLRLFVAFEGRELMEYDTYQGGLKLTHEVNANWQTKLMVSGVKAAEREFTDVEGGYRLCDVDKNLSSQTFNDCVFIRGIGTNYDYGRNILDAEIINIENRHEIEQDKYTLAFGLGYTYQDINDQLNEYSFRDSADYVIDIVTTASNNRIASNTYFGYLQSSFELGPYISTTIGARLTHWDFNNQWLVSPRGQVSYRPPWERDMVFRASAGVYQQLPFYRELRDFNGNINEHLQAQRSVHVIGGIDYNFKWWGRDFKFTGEGYYKWLDHVIIYDIDNVKVRYYANNDATGYVTGLDLRVSGEFIKDTESWFSLSVLNAREDAANDGKGYIRRPTDQRINAAIFFQDHLPNNPKIRVSLNLLYGSGLPFGPPNNYQNRNTFNGDAYKRVDVGFSRLFFINEEKYGDSRTVLVSAEILNLLGTPNVISYTWINDVNNTSFAVPNSLSQRFLNLRLSVKI